MSDANASTILPQGAGYGVVVGIGLFFTAFMLGLTWMQARYTRFSPMNPEEYSSASRSIKKGLMASGIVSAWTCAATLLQSSAVAHRFGIAATWWHGAGATIQILLFAQLAAKLKLNALNVHTFLEIIDTRWGTFAHTIFLFFGLATNIIISSILCLGGSATVTALTGMNTIAACFLIPFSVVIYVIVGGMRGTLLSDYTHTTILFVIIFVFMFTVYGTSDKIGSISKMHELLTQASERNPVPGNAGGSYLTMRSLDGLIFGVINMIGNFGAVFNNQAYWQRAIASDPKSCVKAYLLGGLAWFSIPFAFATTIGFSAVALNGTPGMRPLSPQDISAGLAAPYAAAALLGSTGAAAILVLIFFAVTSATSGELIAVSSILTYDVYKRYINPNATGKQIFRVSQLMVALFALAMSLFGVIFFYIGISLGWLCSFMGTLLGSAVVPITLCATWSKANKWGCIHGAIWGLVAGMIAWIVTTAKLNSGVINVKTTGGDYEMLAGNLAAIGVGGIIAVVVSLIYPDNFDFKTTRLINAPKDFKITMGTVATNEEVRNENAVENGVTERDAESPQEKVTGITRLGEEARAALKKDFKFAVWASFALTVIMIILIPIPLYGASTTYGVAGFTVWIVLAMLWAFFASFVVVLYPLWESRQALKIVFKGVFKDFKKPGSGKVVTVSPYGL